MSSQVLKRSLFSIAAMAVVLSLLGLQQPTASAVDIVWDGGDGAWNDGPFHSPPTTGKWNGGQDAFAVFGREDGWQFGSGEIGSDVFIHSGNVTYDSNFYKDFRFIAGAPENGGTLTIGDGPDSPASLSMDLSFDEGADQDGFWSQFNAGTLNLNNGVFRRTHTPTTDGTPSSGGLMQFGGIRGFPNADINVNITNGGRIENDGQLTFGWYLQGDDAVGRKITFTIDDGHLDLTGSTKWDHLGGAAGGAGNADLNIQYGWDSVADAPAGEEYAINFVGPGSITVDEGGILVGRQTAFTDQPDAGAFDFESLTTPRTYEYLWDIGILQADGVSGLDGGDFSTYFDVENSLGEADYKLISKVGENSIADLNMDGFVDGLDLGILLGEWDPPVAEAMGISGGGAVPEPTSAVLLVSACCLLGLRRRA